MRLYLDSGAFLKLYVAEPGSESVAAAVGPTTRLTLNAFQELEMRGALQAAIGRGILTADAAKQASVLLNADLASGRVLRDEVDWPAIFADASLLAHAHTRVTLCRTLDILHVAAARALNGHVITTDRRQFDLCERIHHPATLVRI